MISFYRAIADTPFDIDVREEFIYHLGKVGAIKEMWEVFNSIIRPRINTMRSLMLVFKDVGGWNEIIKVYLYIVSLSIYLSIHPMSLYQSISVFNHTLYCSE